MPTRKRSPAIFRARIAAAGLSQVEFARIVKRTPETVNRWATGKVAIPEYVWITLSVLPQKSKA